MTRYDDVDYWDDRYSNDKDPFEWYQTYIGIRHFLTPKYLCHTGNAPTSQGNSADDKQTQSTTDREFLHANRVLILGCGNSDLGQNMLQDGFTYIANERKLKDVESNNSKTALNRTKLSDSSPARKEFKKKPVHNKMTFQCLDVTKKLEFDDESFDLIICKGMLDAILCNTNALVDKVKSMMSECHRVLDKEHGVMVVISYGRPEDRLECFDAAQWREVKTFTVPKPMVPGMTDVGA
ncbi:hypothetical protein HJC23_012752 [Cyclotella cryptica]|uniref:Methyltransferase type 11 domain-containing protein n=1 Tax=Cyclotella cryptica TaxID=29204 RepID=A0ABD3Q332_9STRA